MKCECCKNNESMKDSKICNDCDCSIKIMADYNEEMSQQADKQIKIDTEFLNSINYLFAKRIKKFFDDQMNDCGGRNFELVDKPIGEKQPVSYAINYYVDQWSVGDGGDSFEGNCYLQLANNKYLTWWFEC